MADSIALPSAPAQFRLAKLSDWSLLLTKLRRPLLSDNLIDRDALVMRNLERQGHWCIYGSAGYGKTTLASAYCKNAYADYGWLCLDADDNDPERFSLYVAAAFISACPDCDRFCAMVEAQESLQLNQIITSILNEALLVQRPIVLVLDDYHVIHNATIHSGVAMLMTRASDNFRIILTSRTRPPLSLSSLQMQGRLYYSGVDELAFTQEESLSYIQQLCPQLAIEQVVPLLRAIEGWPAGLRSLVMFFANNDQRSPKFSTATLITNSVISDYFWEQVLEKLSPELQTFLLHTSVLTIFDSELCVAVTGHSQSAQLLNDIVQKQLFITHLDPEKKWFRYHNLFQEFLLKHLQLTAGELFKNLHVRAAESWLQHGNIANALKHALTVGDLDVVVKTLIHPQQALMAQGNGALLEQAILLLTEDQICQHPTMMMLACRYWMNRNQDKVLHLLDMASTRMDAADNQPSIRHMRALLELYRAQVAIMRDQISQAIAWADLALKDLPAADFASRSQACVLLAEAHTRMGNIQQATQDWQTGERLAQQANKPSLVAWSRHQFAMLELGQGAFAKAQQLQDQAIAYTEQACFYGDKQLWFLHRARAETAWEYFDLEGVEFYSKKALQVCQHWLQNGEVPVEIIYARTQLLLGNQSTAYAHLQRATELSKTVTSCSYVNSYLNLALAEFHLRFSPQSALTQLLHNLPSSDNYSNDIAQRNGRAQAICHFGLGNIIEASALLNAMNSDAERYHLVTERWRNTFWLVACELAQSQREQAISLLTECVVFAAERGLMGSLLVTAPYIEDLFELKIGMADVHWRHWRRAQDLLSHSRAHTHKDQQVPKAINALAITPKEWRVFELILTGAGNEEIAVRLNLSLGTVKNTLTRIYRKLDVTDRESACRIAQQLLAAD